MVSEVDDGGDDRHVLGRTELVWHDSQMLLPAGARLDQSPVVFPWMVWSAYSDSKAEGVERRLPATGQV